MLESLSVVAELGEVQSLYGLKRKLCDTCYWISIFICIESNHSLDYMGGKNRGCCICSATSLETHQKTYGILDA